MYNRAMFLTIPAWATFMWAVLAAAPAASAQNGYYLPPEFVDMTDTIWTNRKQYLINYIHTGFAAPDPYEDDPNHLYHIQKYTHNLLKYAARTQRYAILDGLAELYLVAYSYLSDMDQYLYPYPNPTGYTPSKEWRSLSPSAKMWIGHIDYKDGREQPLCSSQFLYAVASAINAILDVPAGSRTTNMNDLISLYVPVIITDHYKRWVFAPTGEGVFHVAGWHCNPGTFNHKEFLQKKYNLEFGTDVYYPYCNAVRDMDELILAGVVEMLAAHNKDDQLVPIDPTLEQDFLDYVDIGTDLLDSRMSQTSLTDFDGAPVTGMNFDVGIWDTYYQKDYAGYTDEDVFPIGPPVPATGTGMDISHARRWPHTFGTLHEHRNITGQTFPDDTVLEGLANQYAYAVFNKDFTYPRFANFNDGTNGWYRVNYGGEMGFGYGPSQMSHAMIEGGYAFWSQYNGDLRTIMDTLWDMISAVYITDDSGNKHDVMTFGSQWTSSSYSGGAMQFDGIDDYINCGKFDSWNASQGTIEFWFKPNTLGSSQYIMEVFETGYEDYLRVRMLDSNKMNLRIEDDNSEMVNLTSSTSISSTGWHHVVITQNGTAAKIYISGSDANATGTNSGYWTDHLVLSLGSAGFWIGKGHNNGIFEGSIDEVRIYNRAISSTEAQEHLNGTFNNNQGLLAYWSFDQEPDHDMIEHVEDYFARVVWVDYARIDPIMDYGKSDSLYLLMYLPSLVCTDADSDTVCDDSDNCPDDPNTDQSDIDSDGVGDVCDDDTDNDGIPDTQDNCPSTPNADQLDTDSDGAGDVCDNDDDGDTILDINDNCPLVVNTGQEDDDSDGVGDACDDCPDTLSGALVDANGCPLPIPGDFDGDSDVDQEDFGLLQACLTGSGIVQNKPNCQVARLDEDYDVDADDVAIYWACMSGPHIAGDTNCAN